MQNFIFNTPTRVFFGKGQISVLGEQLKVFGAPVLVVIGKGSVKRNGILNAVIEQLSASGLRFVELEGVDPNPQIATVRQGAELCREHGVKVVLAVGGGSVIDCAKAIAFAAGYDGDPWDFWMGKTTPEKVLPIACVLTMAATGSEMNWGAVISNKETEDKRGKGNPLFIPRFSILDPEYSFTVPASQTAAGTADIMAHVHEYYFAPETEAFLQDCFLEGILKTCIKYGPIALAEPTHYLARANLMWASSMALNGAASRGKSFEGTLHSMEHAVSALSDLTHGVGLAILTIGWMRYVLNETTLWRFLDYARNVWGLEGPDTRETAERGITSLETFYKKLGLPLSLSEVGIDTSRFKDMLDRCAPDDDKTSGKFAPLKRSDIEAIFHLVK